MICEVKATVPFEAEKAKIFGNATCKAVSTGIFRASHVDKPTVMSVSL
jgi:hypothetical protein